MSDEKLTDKHQMRNAPKSLVVRWDFKNIPKKLDERLKKVAAQNKRSKISQLIIAVEKGLK